MALSTDTFCSTRFTIRKFAWVRLGGDAPQGRGRRAIGMAIGMKVLRRIRSERIGNRVGAKRNGESEPPPKGERRMRRLSAVGSTFLFATCLIARAEEAVTPVAVGARFSQDENGADFLFDLSRSVTPRVYALASPDQIVIDLPEVNFQLDPSLGRVVAGNSGAIVKAFRFGLLGPHGSRIVIDLARSACPARVESKPVVEGALASRLRIEVRPCDEAAFAGLIRPADELDQRPQSLGPSGATSDCN